MKFKEGIKRQERINARVRFIEGDMTPTELAAWKLQVTLNPSPSPSPNPNPNPNPNLNPDPNPNPNQVVLRLSLGEGGAVCAALEAHALPGLPATARTLTEEERDMVKKADALARVRSARPRNLLTYGLPMTPTILGPLGPPSYLLK